MGVGTLLMALGEWKGQAPPDDKFVRANLGLAESAATKRSRWSRIRGRLEREPLTLTLLLIGLFLLVAGLPTGLRWESSPEGSPVGLGFRFSRLNPMLMAASILALVGGVVLLNVQRHRVGLFLALIVVPGLLVDDPSFWLFLGIACVFALSFHVMNE